MINTPQFLHIVNFSYFFGLLRLAILKEFITAVYILSSGCIMMTFLKLYFKMFFIKHGYWLSSLEEK